jgi:hypothetical protein
VVLMAFGTDHELRIIYRREVMRSLPHIYRVNFWWFFDRRTIGDDFDVCWAEIREWCVANFREGNYDIDGDEVHILHDRDAISFRLRWC